MIVPYILGAEFAYFRRRRYFVKLGKQVVGIFAFHEKPETLHVSSLAVALGYRRLRIAKYMLVHATHVAKQLNKNQLELSVLKTNTPALQLYREFGFSLEKERKWALILTKTLGSSDDDHGKS